NCYSLIFRSKVIQKKYKDLHDTLRTALEDHLIKCQEADLIDVEQPAKTANMIFCLLDGAYVYLCMENDKSRQVEIMNDCKEQVYTLIGLEHTLPADA
ncbi:MAG: TetR/AcrR family transcriptional regulator, partial [Bacteroidota bacterium]